MISFYPGPSKLYPQVYDFMQDAIHEGVFSLNHRSGEFTKIIASAIEGLQSQLNLPKDYQVYFVSSATECWEIIAQSFIQENSLHIYSGAFGEKWYNYTKRLHPQALRCEFDFNELPTVPKIDSIPEVICLTHSETSNGTMLSKTYLDNIRKSFPDALVAMDVTSSVAGVNIDFTLGDIFYASVQKCFGLPAGMGIMICSPKAQQHGLDLAENNHYNSFQNLHVNAVKNQTTHTPNTLNIYLMKRLLPSIGHIEQIDEVIKNRAEDWYKFFESFKDFQLLVQNKGNRSETVIAIEAELDTLNKIKNKAREQNILLGRGYGKWLNRSFRIANFPAIDDAEIDILKNFFLTTVS